jgi:hypothetical protein
MKKLGNRTKRTKEPGNKTAKIRKTHPPPATMVDFPTSFTLGRNITMEAREDSSACQHEGRGGQPLELRGTGVSTNSSVGSNHIPQQVEFNTERDASKHVMTAHKLQQMASKPQILPATP